MRFVAILFLALAWSAPAYAQRDPVHEALDAYALYQNDITHLLEHQVLSPPDIDRTLERAVRHDPARVSQGWIAYGALTAAQSPAFVRGVRSRVTAAGRAPVLRQVRRDITYARRRPPGAGEAIQLILAASAADGARLATAGARYRAIGDTLDISAWTPSTAALRDARNGRLRALSRHRRDIDPAQAPLLHINAATAAPLTNADAFGGTRFWDALAARASPEPPATARRESTVAAPSTDRMLTLAALVILEAAPSEPTRVAAMLDDQRTRDCLAMEQLQLRQCASVANYANEDAYCLARHGLTAPGQCFAAIAVAP